MPKIVMSHQRRTPLVVAAAGVLALLAGIGFGLFLFQRPAPSSHPGADQTGAEQTQQDSSASAPACSSDHGITLPDASTVPEPGPALAIALNNAVATYFLCQSLPIKQFADTFATLSVVIGQYAPDPSCFKGNDDMASSSWPFNKAWADRQGHADALRANMRLKLGYVLGCLPPEQQKLFYGDFVRAFTFAAGAQSLQTFVNPVFKGQRIGRCLYDGRDCDEPAALNWCARFGYSRMTKWEWVYVPQTITLGDQKTCTGKCGAFTTIICAR